MIIERWKGSRMLKPLVEDQPCTIRTTSLGAAISIAEHWHGGNQVRHEVRLTGDEAAEFYRALLRDAPPFFIRRLLAEHLELRDETETLKEELEELREQARKRYIPN